MTNEELLSVAEIVEKLTDRFNAQAAYHRERFDEHVKLIASMKADHEAKMVEHRAAFGARTEADAKIIAGLREELEGVGKGEGIRKSAERLVQERDGLLTQVQDMRAEMERLRIEAAKCKAERDDLYQLEGIEQKRRMDVEDERDALLAEVDFLKTLRPKYKVGDKLMSHSQSLGPEVPVTVQGIRVVYDCSVDGAKYECVVGHAERELILVASHDTDAGKAAAESAIQGDRSGGIVVGDVVRATFWKPGQMSTVTQILPDGRLILEVSSEPWRVDEVVKLTRKCVGADEAWTDVRKVTT